MRKLGRPIAIMLLISIGTVTCTGTWFLLSNMLASPIKTKNLGPKRITELELTKLGFINCIKKNGTYREIVFYNPTYKTIVLKNANATLRTKDYVKIGSITFYENAEPYKPIVGYSSIPLNQGVEYKITFEKVEIPDITIVCY